MCCVLEQDTLSAGFKTLVQSRKTGNLSNMADNEYIIFI